MELRQYFSIVRRWWWLMAACVLVASVSSYLGTRQMPRIYQATTTVMVGQTLEQANPDTQDLYTSRQLASSYAALIQREPIRRAAAEALGLNYLPSASAQVVEGTQFLAISVLDTDPERARVVADEIAHQLILRTPGASPETLERRAFVQTQLADLEVRIQETQTSIDEEQSRLEAANSARAIQQYQANIAALGQKLSSYQSTYAILLATVQGEVNYISVVEPATKPGWPISPNVSQTVLLAAAIGLALAVGGAFLIEYLDDTVKTSEDVARTANLPILGAIARINGKNYPTRLITVQRPLSPITEAYRVLRTNLQFSAVDKPLRTLMLTSPGPTEGKSVTLANLAVVMAQSGLKVILVDSDLRRPTLHKLFGLSNDHGLTSAIVHSNPGLAEHLQTTDIPNLLLLCSGPLPPNPAEVVGSERMQALVEEMKGRADVVLFDSPPTLVVADAAILSSRVDGVLLVNDAGGTRRNETRQSVEELRRVGANLLGVVLNRLPSHQGRYYYYYYQTENGGGKKRHRHHTWLQRQLSFLRSKRSEPEGAAALSEE